MNSGGGGVRTCTHVCEGGVRRCRSIFFEEKPGFVNISNSRIRGVWIIEKLGGRKEDTFRLGGCTIFSNVHFKTKAGKVAVHKGKSFDQGITGRKGEGTIIDQLINKASISGYLLKQSNANELVIAIKKIASGGQYFPDSILDALEIHSSKKEIIESVKEFIGDIEIIERKNIK